ncbi:hypothetical protein ACPPVO_20805 [Dactylosporangium sp. McL0621]|uniref:hypothetical protein n=1 Tax=Dactylosporangium sp. McL0621 TaxID=3415678 RepID=UPI003CEABDFC
MTTPDDLQFRHDLDADLHVVLPPGGTADGWTIVVVKADGTRILAAPEGPGGFSYYGQQERWWYVDHPGAAHVEVIAPDGTEAVLHHRQRLGGPAETCPLCSAGRPK